MTITISIPQIVINISNTQNLNLEQMSHTLDELLQLATEQSTKEDSLFAIMDGLKKQVADAIANAGSGADADAIQAEVDAVFEKFSSNTQKMADAITANTPASGDGTTPAPTDGGTTTPPVVTEPAPAGGTDTTPPVVDGGGTSTDPVPTTPDAGTPTTPDVPAAPAAPTTPEGVTVI